MQDTIYTIGHSTHPLEHFIGLLREHRISAVCDVRSKPYSKMNPQFNREDLQHALRENGIEYRFFGNELGGRSDDPKCYSDGRVQYTRVAETDSFKQGLDRLRRGMQQDFRIALMCAEKEPLECHRTILVSRRLAESGINVAHIHADGHLEDHEAAVSRLAVLLNLPEYDLFHTHEELVDELYRQQEERIAYAVTESTDNAKVTAE